MPSGTSRKRSTCSAFARTRAAQAVSSSRDEVRAGVDVRVAAGTSTGDLADELRMRRDDRPEAAVAGRLGDEPERRAADQDRVPPGIGG